MGRQVHAVLLSSFATQRLVMVMNKEHHAGLEHLAALADDPMPVTRALGRKPRPSGRGGSPSWRRQVANAAKGCVQGSVLRPSAEGLHGHAGHVPVVVPAEQRRVEHPEDHGDVGHDEEDPGEDRVQLGPFPVSARITGTAMNSSRFHGWFAASRPM